MPHTFPIPLRAVACCLAGWLTLQAHAEQVQIARGGEAMMTLSVSRESTEKLAPSVNRLAAKLSEITGATFTPGDGHPGDTGATPQGRIILGLRTEYPDLLPEVEKDETSTWKERYRLLTREGHLYIIGETDLAVAHGVADLLHRLGYRYLLPPKAWEVIPSQPDLALEVDVTEQPRYATRLLFMGSTTNKALNRATRYHIVESNFGAWRRHMRAFSAFRIRTGHAWVQMARRNEEAFLKNPHWIVEGSPDFRQEGTDRNFKFHLEHDDLIELLQADSIAWLGNNPNSDTVSVDPSDGGNWAEPSPLGSPSDQVVYLANAVSKAIRTEFPEKKVAFYAYHLHSPPPTLELERGVIVNVATGFIRGGFTVDELMKQWRAKGAELGIRDYTNVFFGSWDLPGGNYHAFSPKKTQENLRRYYRNGARYWISETDNAWGAIGLGAYVGFHTLWNPVDGPSAEELVADFIEKGFGKGADAMHRYFKAVAPESHPIVSDDLAARMYGALRDALQAGLTPAERTRVLHLVSYTRFVELMHAFRNADPGKTEKEAFRALCEWAYNCRDFQMFSSRGVFLNSPRKNAALEAIRDEVIQQEIAVPTEKELEALVKERLREVKQIAFQPVTWSEKLEPVGNDAPEPEVQEVKDFAFAQARRLIWQAREKGETLALEIRALGTGRPTPPRATEVSLKLMDDVFNESTLDVEVPAEDAEWRKVELKAPITGMYEVSLLTHGGYIEVRWAEGTPVVVPAGQVGGSALYGTWDASFYVPAGTTRVAGYSERAHGVLLSETGAVLHDFSREKGPGYFDIALEASQKGRVFRFQGAQGRKILMTVPPYLARRGSELLVPADAETSGASAKR